MTVLFRHLIFPYGFLSFLLSDDGLQFVARLFKKLCLGLKVRYLTMIAYHPLTNGLVGGYNKALVARLHSYISDIQKDWDKYVQPLTYAHNTQVHKSVKTTLVSLVLSRQPLSLSTVVPRTRILSDTYREVPPRALRLHLFTLRKPLKMDVKNSLCASQNRHKIDFDKSFRMLLTFEISQFVDMIKPLRAVFASEGRKVAITLYNQLMLRVSDPYEIVTVRGNAMTIPENGTQITIRIHPANRAPGSQGPVTNGDTKNSREHYQTHANETDDHNKDRFAVENITRRITEKDVRKYVVRRYT